MRHLSTIAIFAEALLKRRILFVSLGGFSGLAFGGSQRLNSQNSTKGKGLFSVDICEITLHGSFCIHGLTDYLSDYLGGLMDILNNKYNSYILTIPNFKINLQRPTCISFSAL